MATETLYATALTAGTVSTPANALGAPNGVFTTDTGNVNWTARFALGNPTGAGPLTGTQTCLLRARKSTGTSNPTVGSAAIYEGGTLRSTVTLNTTVTSTTGQDITVNWDGALIADHATVELEISTTGVGGQTSALSSVQLDAITWTAVSSDAAPASAGPDQTVPPWSTVTLTGTGTGTWTQTTGAIVTLGGAGATRTFTAPPAMTQQTLGFSYGTDPMTVTVAPAAHGIKQGDGTVLPVRLTRKP